MPFISSPTLNFTTMVKQLDIEPTYELSSSATQVDEGQQITFTLNTTNVPEGTLVPYSLGGDSGITVDDYEMVSSNEFVPATIQNGNFDNNLDDFILIPSQYNGLPSSEQISWDSFGGLGTCKIRTGKTQVAIRSEISHISSGQQTNSVRITIPHIDGNYIPSFYFTVEGTIYVHLGLPDEWDYIHSSPSFQSVQSFPNMVLNGDGSYSGYIDYQYTYDIKLSERYRLGFYVKTSETQNIPENYSNFYIDSISYTTSNEQKGYFEIGSNDQASVTYLIKDGSGVEGTETLTLSLDNGEDDISVDIIDQSTTYEISSSTTQVNEDGGNVILDISSNVSEEGRSIQFLITEDSATDNIESAYQTYLYDDFTQDVNGWLFYSNGYQGGEYDTANSSGTMRLYSRYSQHTATWAYSPSSWVNHPSSQASTNTIRVYIERIDLNAKIAVFVNTRNSGDPNGSSGWDDVIANTGYITVGTTSSPGLTQVSGQSYYSGYIDLDYQFDGDLDKTYSVRFELDSPNSSAVYSAYIKRVLVYNSSQGNLGKLGTITPSSTDGSARLLLNLKKDSDVYEGNDFDITFSETGSEFKLDTDSDFTEDSITKTINIIEQDTINYNVTASPLTISEGSSAVTVNISASNVLNFSSDRTLTVSSSDSTQVILSDTQVIIPAGQTSTTFTFTPVDDSIVESNEVITLTVSDLESSNFTVNGVLSDSVGTCSVEINLLDNDYVEYTLSSSATQVDEGQQVTFTLNTTNVPEGELVPYTIQSSSDITSQALTNSDFNTNMDDWTNTVDQHSSVTFDSKYGGSQRHLGRYDDATSTRATITHPISGLQTNKVRVNIPEVSYFHNLAYVAIRKNDNEWLTSTPTFVEIQNHPNMSDSSTLNNNGNANFWSGYIEVEYTEDVDPNATYEVYFAFMSSSYSQLDAYCYLDSIEITSSVGYVSDNDLEILGSQATLDETISLETDLVNEHNGSSTNGIYISSLEYLENGIVLAGTYTSGSSNGSGRIYRSTDNGENWTVANTFTNINTVNVIKYLGDGVVLAGTAGNSGDGNVYKSTDSGQSWSIVSDVSSHENIENLEYLGNGICIFGAGNSSGDGYIYRSTDYGENWSVTDSSNSIFSNSKRTATFKYLGDGICMGSRMTNGNQFVLIRSTDYGATWSDIGQTTLLSAQSSSFPAIAYLGDGKVAVAATNTTSYVYISSDYGQTFDTTAKFTVSEWVMCMEHLGNGRVVLGTYSGNSSTETNSGKLYESTDYGQTWNSTAIFSPGVKRINKLRLNPENNTLLIGCKDNSDEPTVYILGDTSPVKNFIVDSNGEASVTYLVKDDSAVEGTEQLNLSLDNGEDSVSVDIIDIINGYRMIDSFDQNISNWQTTTDDENGYIRSYFEWSSSYGGSLLGKSKRGSAYSATATTVLDHYISGTQTNRIKINIPSFSGLSRVYVEILKNDSSIYTTGWFNLIDTNSTSFGFVTSVNGTNSGYLEIDYTDNIDLNANYQLRIGVSQASWHADYSTFNISDISIDTIDQTSSTTIVFQDDLQSDASGWTLQASASGGYPSAYCAFEDAATSGLSTGSIRMRGSSYGYWAQAFINVSHNFIEGNNYRLSFDILTHVPSPSNQDYSFGIRTIPSSGVGSTVSLDIISSNNSSGISNLTGDNFPYTFTHDFVGVSSITSGCQIYISTGGLPYNSNSSAGIWFNNVKIEAI